MNAGSLRWTVLVLRLVLGVVLLIGSLTTMHHAAEDLGVNSGLVPIVHGLAAVEVLGAFLLLLPWTVLVGAWTLIAVVAIAMVIHLLHGLHNIGVLAVYEAAVLVILAEHRSRARSKTPEARTS